MADQDGACIYVGTYSSEVDVVWDPEAVKVAPVGRGRPLRRGRRHRLRLAHGCRHRGRLRAARSTGSAARGLLRI